MQVLSEQLHTAIWVYDFDLDRIIWANTSALRLWDSPSICELSQRDLQTSQSPALQESLKNYQAAFKQNQKKQIPWTLYPKGKKVNTFCHFSGIYLADGRLAMLVEATRMDEMQINPALVGSMILANFTEDGQFISSNRLFNEYFSSAMLSIHALFCKPKQVERLLKKTHNGKSFAADALLKSKNGERWFNVNAQCSPGPANTTRILLHLFDIHARKLNENNLHQQATSDPLTGLINRRGLTDMLQKNIKTDIPFTLLYIDLDGFKMINDALGHCVGDEVLNEVSARLTSLTGKKEKISRFGGDEFILLNSSLISNEQLNNRCQEIIKSLSAPYRLPHGRKLPLSVSIGVAQYPEDAQTMENILLCADSAMYQAKQQGKKRWIRYATGMEALTKRISIVAQKLSFAITNQELFLYYQPIVNTLSKKIVGFEALLRWYNDELGYINPQEAIEIAEQTGLIHEIEHWVFNQAIQDTLILQKVYGQDVTMSVNVSGKHFVDPRLFDSILTPLNKFQVNPEHLMIELTESVLVKDMVRSNQVIKQLCEHKIRLNIDDFGTGYSSLAYLHRFPATTVKVDQSFVKTSETHQMTLKCIYDLVSSLKMQSLIEGVESERQADRLTSLGFILQQGYFHGRPQPLSAYLKK